MFLINRLSNQCRKSTGVSRGAIVGGTFAAVAVVVGILYATGVIGKKKKHPIMELNSTTPYPVLVRLKRVEQGDNGPI